MENEKKVYYFYESKNIKAFEKSVLAIKGVTYCKVEDDHFEYSIDEWSSDYDIFVEIVYAAQATGTEIDFERSENERSAKEAKEAAVEQVVEPEIEEEPVEEEEEKKPSSDKKDGLSDNWQRVIELGISLVCMIVGLLINGRAQLLFFAVTFTLAGYDVIFEGITKVSEKKFINNEFVFMLALVGALLLGYSNFAVVALMCVSTLKLGYKAVNSYFENKKNKILNNPGCVLNDKGEEIAVSEVVVGEVYTSAGGFNLAFDGTLESDSAVVYRADGNKISLKKGDAVYAGDYTGEDIAVKVSHTASESKLASFYAKTQNTLSGGKVLGFAQKENIYNIVLIALGLLIAFIPPIFGTSYSRGLSKWGMRAVCIVATGLPMWLGVAVKQQITAAIDHAKLAGTIITSQDAIERLANYNTYIFDCEASLLAKNGEFKQDCGGAVMELKDSGAGKTVLLTDKDEEYAIENAKKLKIKQYSAELNGDAKLEKATALAESGACLVGEDVASTENLATIALNGFEKGGEKADAVILGDGIAYVPFARKVCRRLYNCCKATLLLAVIAKAILAILAAFGIANLWIVALSDCAIGGIALLLCLLCGKKL